LSSAKKTQAVIKVRVKADTDIEANEAFTITLSDPVNATIVGGNANGTIISDDVVDVAPSNIRLTTGGTATSVDENKTGGHVVATVVADDDGGAGGQRYSMDHEIFEIDSVSGQIRVRSGVTLNYEDQGTYTVEVAVTDLNGAGQTSTQNITINLNDLSERATGITFVDADEVLQVGVSGLGSRVAVATANDPDAAAEFSANLYRFDNGESITSDGLFVINAITGEITTNRALTAADIGTKTLNVVTYDAANQNLFSVKSYAVFINPPRSAALDSSSAQELAVAGTVVGTLTAQDDEGHAFTYELLDDAGGRFALGANGRSIMVKNGNLLDFEQAQAHTIQVRVKVAGVEGQDFVQNLTIGVADVNPELANGTDAFDRFVGGSLTDTLSSHGGNDTLAGGYGNDTLSGGLGQDTFVFDTALGTAKTDCKVNFDKILDFNVKDDTIQLENAIFKKLKKTGALSSKSFVLGAQAKDKDDYIGYDKKKGVLWYDADGSGKGAAVEIAQLAKKLKLTAKDFFII
jgi:Ca2+-binding RTX toxin-like protein